MSQCFRQEVESFWILPGWLIAVSVLIRKYNTFLLKTILALTDRKPSNILPTKLLSTEGSSIRFCWEDFWFWDWRSYFVFGTIFLIKVSVIHLRHVPFNISLSFEHLMHLSIWLSHFLTICLLTPHHFWCLCSTYEQDRRKEILSQNEFGSTYPTKKI